MRRLRYNLIGTATFKGPEMRVLDLAITIYLLKSILWLWSFVREMAREEPTSRERNHQNQDTSRITPTCDLSWLCNGSMRPPSRGALMQLSSITAACQS